MGGYAFCAGMRTNAANAGPLGANARGNDVNRPKLGAVRTWGHCLPRSKV